MTVEILLFGPEAAAAQRDRIQVEIGERATCGSLRGALARLEPALLPTLAAARFAVNGEFVGDDRTLQTGDEVALIGMVSGG